MSEVDRLISGLDHDGLVRYVDACCASRDWKELLRLRDKCVLANDSGRQMWPITTLANYRLALHAPASFAVHALQNFEQLTSSFAIGPLSEVIAQNHTWKELSPLLDDPYQHDLVAHECGIRGGDVTSGFPGTVFDIPATLQRWEPRYQLPIYNDAGVQHNPPELSMTHENIEAEPNGASIGDPDSLSALRAIVQPWAAASNGCVEIAMVEGGAATALGALGVTRARVGHIGPQEALEWLAWAGASGGAHGRRRGIASGRYAAWWALVALGGLTSDWPLAPSEVGEITSQLNWYAWDAYEHSSGWRLQLIIEDPVDGVTWAINAIDSAM